MAGYAPHNGALIVEVLMDNNNRTAPEMRLLFKKAQLGTPGATSFSSIMSGWWRRIIHLAFGGEHSFGLGGGMEEVKQWIE